MEKDFDTWNSKKKLVNEEESRLYTVREIWWCSLGVNVGTEQDGGGENFLRPVVILCPVNRNACLVVPLTTSTREHRLRLPIGRVKGFEARANISQIRVIDARRLVEKVGFLEQSAFRRIRKAVRDLL